MVSANLRLIHQQMIISILSKFILMILHVLFFYFLALNVIFIIYRVYEQPKPSIDK